MFASLSGSLLLRACMDAGNKIIFYCVLRGEEETQTTEVQLAPLIRGFAFLQLTIVQKYEMGNSRNKSIHEFEIVHCALTSTAQLIGGHLAK